MGGMVDVTLIRARRTMSNVFDFVAHKTGYKNVHVPEKKRPQLNVTGVFAGPLSAYFNLSS